MIAHELTQHINRKIVWILPLLLSLDPYAEWMELKCSRGSGYRG